MPVESEWRGRLVVVRTIGAYTNEELRRAVADVASSPGFAHGTGLLFDGSRSETPLSSADVQWRVGWLSGLPAAGYAPHLAVVVRGDEPFRYGLARQLTMLLEPHGLRVGIFPDVTSAQQWLEESLDSE